MSETRLRRIGAMPRPISTIKLLRGERGRRMTLSDAHRVITELAAVGEAIVPFRLTEQEIQELKAMGVKT